MNKAILIMAAIMMSGCASPSKELIPLAEDFETIFCDALASCPSGMECYSFIDQEAPICWEGNPCERCESKSCMQLESYPVQIRCD